MEDQKQQVIDSLKQANNILVTVKSSPSIDQLAACIALTLILNDQDKHGTAVFSGEVPSVLEFLEPGKTLERNTDSLQDFIISLDKSKADKLRYKVEDSVVRIFITPYKTSISEKDLEFGQGDFNVDVVVALGVHNQNDLDQAITSHGRILHDATVISMNTEPGDSEDLGSINWTDVDSSSLSEMVASMADSLAKEPKDKEDRNEHRKGDVIDNQIATALLTGIVAETERFGNAKTTPATMEMAARLLTAGANQELVASKLAESQQSNHSAPHENHTEEPKTEEPKDEHENEHGDEHTEDTSKEGDKESAGELAGPLTPSLLQPTEPGSSSKSIYEADPDEASDDDHKNDDEDDGGEGGSTATTDLTDPDKPAGDGSLDITHPEDETGQSDLTDGSAQTIDHQDDPVTTLAEPSNPSPGTEPEVVQKTVDDKEDSDLALAHAGTEFDMPQPVDAGLIAPLAAPLPATPAEPAPDPTPALAPVAAGPVEPSGLTTGLLSPADGAAPVQSSEDQAALDMLKEHHVQQPDTATIQPLHTHGVYIAPPTHDEAGGSVDVPSASAETEVPSGSSYGLAPPMMGGTLTSNSTDDPSSHGASEPKEAHQATLTHSQPDFSHLPKPLETNPAQQPSPVQPSVAPAPAAPPAFPSPTIPEGPLIAPLTATPANAAPTPVASPSTTSAEQSPPAGSMDMPMPTPMLTPLLQPNSPSQPSQNAMPATTPLPPTPPPLTPPIAI
jgi:hypothetical protein